MANWIECQPGFRIPRTLDCSQYAPFEELGLRLEDAPELEDVFIVRDLFRPSSQQWAIWLGAERADRLPALPPDVLEQIARRLYESARFVHLVPAWRRAMVEWLTEIDDLEDQVSTVLIVLEWIARKFIPVPRGVLDAGHDAKRLLDRAEQLLAGVPVDRTTKAEWAASQKDALERKRRGRRGIAKLLDWLRENWGALLEAAQATDTWFDVGIALGPIIGFLEEGLWAAARATIDNYLIAVDAIAPGYRDDFWRNAEELSDQIDQVIENMGMGAVGDPSGWQENLSADVPLTEVDGSPPPQINFWQ